TGGEAGARTRGILWDGSRNTAVIVFGDVGGDGDLRRHNFLQLSQLSEEEGHKETRVNLVKRKDTETREVDPEELQLSRSTWKRSTLSLVLNNTLKEKSVLVILQLEHSLLKDTGRNPLRTRSVLLGLDHQRLHVSASPVNIEPHKFSLDVLVRWQEVPQHATQPAKSWVRI
ncbi:hypothetical protein KUCAC02_026504, partial [Chaenocephalus aceratus]